MLENFREWLAAALPAIVESTAFLFTLIILLVFLKKKRLQFHTDRWNKRLGEICTWVKDSVEFYSAHFAYLTVEAFSEDEVLHKLSRLAPTRQQAARQCGRIGDEELCEALACFNLVEFQIFNMSNNRSSRALEEYRGLLDQLRSTGETILQRVDALKI